MSNMDDRKPPAFDYDLPSDDDTSKAGKVRFDLGEKENDSEVFVECRQNDDKIGGVKDVEDKDKMYKEEVIEAINEGKDGEGKDGEGGEERKGEVEQEQNENNDDSSFNESLFRDRFDDMFVTGLLDAQYYDNKVWYWDGRFTSITSLKDFLLWGCVDLVKWALKEMVQNFDVKYSIVRPLNNMDILATALQYRLVNKTGEYCLFLQCFLP